MAPNDDRHSHAMVLVGSSGGGASYASSGGPSGRGAAVVVDDDEHASFREILPCVDVDDASNNNNSAASPAAAVDTQPQAFSVPPLPYRQHFGGVTFAAETVGVAASSSVGGGSGSSVLSSVEWPCGVCTFINSPEAKRCDMCDTLRGAAAPA